MKEEHMNASEIIRYISESEKKTPVRVYLKWKEGAAKEAFQGCRRFGAGDEIIFGDWKDVAPVLSAAKDKIDDVVVENDCRNSAIPLLDMKEIPARIEPGRCDQRAGRDWKKCGHHDGGANQHRGVYR